MTKQVTIESGTSSEEGGSILLEAGTIDMSADAVVFEGSDFYILQEVTATDSYRPLEGDAIYHPILEKMFQINFVDHDEPFHQLDNNPVYKLRCRLFDYSMEDLDTGITDIDAIEWMEKLQKLGAGEILLTSMDKDGTKSGFDLELLKTTTKKLTIPVIASGGVGSLQDFKDGVIVGGASALLAASVFHYNEYSISDVKEYLKNENIEVRL